MEVTTSIAIRFACYKLRLHRLRNTTVSESFVDLDSRLEKVKILTRAKWKK